MCIYKNIPSLACVFFGGIWTDFIWPGLYLGALVTQEHIFRFGHFAPADKKVR